MVSTKTSSRWTFLPPGTHVMFALTNGRHLSKHENCKKHQNIALDPLPPVVVMPFFFEDSVVFFAFSSNSACTTDKLSLITAPHRSDQNIRRVDAWTSTHRCSDVGGDGIPAVLNALCHKATYAKPLFLPHFLL